MKQIVRPIITIGLEWEIERHTALNAVYAPFFTGDYIKQTGPESDIDFVRTWIQYKF